MYRKWDKYKYIGQKVRIQIEEYIFVIVLKRKLVILENKTLILH